MTASGIAQMLRRRGRQAGLGPIHPHQFRYTWAHDYLVRGGRESHLMSNAGWKSRQMVSRYGAFAGAERARAEQVTLSHRDRL